MKRAPLFVFVAWLAVNAVLIWTDTTKGPLVVLGELLTIVLVVCVVWWLVKVARGKIRAL